MSSLDQTETIAAQAIVKYFNSQLAQNHDNALDWFSSLQTEDRQNGEWDNWFAWATYRHRVRGTDGEMFEFAFSKPTLTFICDHDALLHIAIKSVDKIIQAGSQSESRTTVQTSAVTMSYRIPTVHRSIVGNDVKLGDHESRIRLLVCDFDNATFTKSTGIVPDDSELKPDIKHYISSYLKALQSGGHHALFFPPEFSQDDKRPDIHLSLAGTLVDRVPLDNLFGRTPEMINGYLSLLWYTCAFIARERGQGNGTVWDRSSSLAGYSSWLFPDFKSDWHVSLKFGEPTVTILCQREVILHFVLTKVSFYETSKYPEGNIVEKPVPDYQNWTIGLIVDISASKAGIIIKPASARYAMEFTQFPGLDREAHASARDVLTHFFVERYFKLIAATRLKYLFRRIEAEYIDTSPSRVDLDGSWWMLERNSGFGTRVDSSHIRDTTMKDFDVVIAVSQASINAQILQRFKMDRSARWMKDESYDIEVKAVTVRLLDLDEAREVQRTPAVEVDSDSDDESTLDGTTPTKGTTPVSRAIVTIHVMQATLKETFNSELEPESTPGSPIYPNYQLAFEVEIKDCDHWKLDSPKYNGPYPDLPSKREDSDYVLQHIYLDLKNAHFSPEYSLWDDETYSNSTERHTRMSLAETVKANYFPHLLERGMHILASVPLYNHAATEGFHRLTSMSYRTFSAETAVARGTTQEESVTRSEQILFVLGMVGGKPLPPLNFFKPSTSWFVRGGFSHGTLAISRQAFYGRLLRLLARVNARTTLEPVSRENQGRVTGNLVQQWAEHPERKSENCDWMPVDAGEDEYSSKFEWRWFHERRVQEQGIPPSRRREYLIRCTTRNELELPDISTFSSGCVEIKLSGMLELEISSDTRSSKAWSGYFPSTKSTAPWNTTIVIKTSARGNVEVEIEGLDDIQYSESKATIKRRGTNPPDADATLREHRLKKADFANVLQELKELQGNWKYYYPASSPFTLCTPMSNLDGDLLFELRPFRTATKAPERTGIRTGASALAPTAQDSQIATAHELGSTVTLTLDTTSKSLPTVSAPPENMLQTPSTASAQKSKDKDPSLKEPPFISLSRDG